jgi:hypothetical protein
LGIRGLAIAAAFAAQAIGYPPFDVSEIHVSKPTEICEIDLTMLGGELRRLSWSPDGKYIHSPDVSRRDARPLRRARRR